MSDKHDTIDIGGDHRGDVINPQKVNADSVSTEFVQMGTDPVRPGISQSQRTVTVGEDVSTIQDAFDRAAVVQAHQIVVDIPDGDYTAEDPVLAGPSGGALRDGATVSVYVRGNRDTPSNVKIGSMMVGDMPCWVNLAGFRLTANNPYSDENSHLGAYNSNHVSVRDVEVRNGTNGIMSYNSNVEIAGVDFGTDSLSGSGIQTKHEGIAWEQEAVATPSQGNVGANAYAPQSGTIYIRSNASTLSGAALASSDSFGRVFDYSTHTIVGGSPSPMGGGPATFEFQMTTESADNVTVNAGATETIFDTSASGNCGIFGGLINGFDPTNITVTWHDGSTQTLGAGSGGTDDGGNISSPVPVPALGPVQKLTFDNGDGSTARDYGWTVYRSSI